MDRLNIIPYPNEVRLNGGTLALNTVELKGEISGGAEFFERIAEMKGIAIEEGGVEIRYFVDEQSSLPHEGYILSVTADGVDISAKDEGGLLYAFVTLIKLISAYGCEVPTVEIKDYPKTAYRGMLLDVSRYFFSVEEVYRFADFCALHKLNALHLHLTDDQGWRIEISKYPLLTEIGSYRTHTNFGCKPHSGFYTKDDIANIISYCNSLNIEVIPEIDLPGHTRSAIAAYPELGCFGRKIKVATHSGVKHDILCAGKEKVYEFVKDVLDEVMETFGGNTKYIHIGGDEVFKHRWEHCPDCQRKIKEEGLEGTEGLQGYFAERIGGYIVEKGFIPVMWNECSVGAIGSQSVCEYWGNTYVSGLVDFKKTANRFGKIINTDSGYCYVDLPYSYIGLKRAYEFEVAPNVVGEDKISGGEISLWTEYVPNFKVAMKRLVPRAEALAEAMWTSGDRRYEDFVQRLKSELAFLAEFGFRGVSVKRANPSKLAGFFETLWFERRQLHWEGLHNLIDDAGVARRYGKKK